MHVTFSIQISEEQYSFQGDYGEATSQIEVPQELLENTDINVGGIFRYLLACAMSDYRQKKGAGDE